MQVMPDRRQDMGLPLQLQLLVDILQDVIFVTDRLSKAVLALHIPWRYGTCFDSLDGFERDRGRQSLTFEGREYQQMHP